MLLPDGVLRPALSILIATAAGDVNCTQLGRWGGDITNTIHYEDAAGMTLAVRENLIICAHHLPQSSEPASTAP